MSFTSDERIEILVGLTLRRRDLARTIRRVFKDPIKNADTRRIFRADMKAAKSARLKIIQG